LLFNSCLTLLVVHLSLFLLKERIAELEEVAMGDKPWHLVGEVPGASRPLNSALEIDMDYDTTNKPPPAPTEEATHSLEDMIKKRIADAR
jgi:U3 small nucleolar RNA-associated protein MPP10